jgi:hypothetical protein
MVANRRFREDSKAPGVWAMNGSAGAIYPEDYNEAGSMWDHLERHGIEFFNFGFSVMFEPASYDPAYKYEGIRLIAKLSHSSTSDASIITHLPNLQYGHS